jgi:lipopolysaccharide transport system permease protein
LLAGLLPWLSIADGIARATGSLVGQEQFLQKVVFPIEVIPITAIMTSLVTQLIGTAFLLLFLIATGMLSLRWLLLPVLLACQIIMMLGLGCALAVLGVQVKDLLQLVPVLLQFLFYSAPILYSRSFIAPGYHKFFLLNPFTALMEAYHWVLLGIPIHWPTILALVFWTLLLGLGGWLLFRVLKPTLGDYL